MPLDLRWPLVKAGAGLRRDDLELRPSEGRTNPRCQYERYQHPKIGLFQEVHFPRAVPALKLEKPRYQTFQSFVLYLVKQKSNGFNISSIAGQNERRSTEQVKLIKQGRPLSQKLGQQRSVAAVACVMQWCLAEVVGRRLGQKSSRFGIR